MSKLFTRAEVATHNKVEDMYFIISGEVYDATVFQHDHPGGNKILKVVAGKDATKPFKKNHNERILKNWQYKDLCIGKLAEDQVPEKNAGRFSRMLSWRKVDKKVLEVKVDVKEVPAEIEQAIEEQVEDVAVESSPKRVTFVDVKESEVVSISFATGREKLPGRSTVNVLADELALVAL